MHNFSASAQKTMATINFGPEVLRPIPQADPKRTPLKRRASAPEPASLDFIYGNTDKRYEVGSRIRLQLHGPIITVTATIIKVFAPFTMAAVMVVRIFEPSMDLEGDSVLKAYDNHYNNEVRDQHDVPYWEPKRDMEVEKNRWSKPLVEFFYRIMADDNLYADGRDDGDTSEDGIACTDAKTGDGIAMDEVIVQAMGLKMYRSELEVYRQARQHGIDGTDVPRFISSIRISPSYQSKNCVTRSACIKGIPGILMQYVPGFSLEALCKPGQSPLPRLHWKHVIDDGVRIVANMTATMSFCNKDCCPRNTVVHWDPIQQKWKCKLIDFGHCEIRKEGTRKWAWRETQAWTEEEGMIGQYMQRALEIEQGFDYVWEESQYSRDLACDFRGEFCTGVEPAGYES